MSRPITQSTFLRSLVVLSCVGTLILTVTLRANSVMTPYERDEGEYAYSARLLLQGRVPYKDSFLQKPPLIVYTYAIGQLIYPDAVWPPRVLAILVVWGTSLMVGAVGYRLSGLPGAVPAMFVTPLALSFPYLASLAANTEIFMLLPLTALMALYVWEARIRRSVLVDVLAGSLAVTAVLFKPIAVFPLAVLFTLWLVRSIRQSGYPRGVILKTGYWTVGGMALCVPAIMYIVLRGGGSEMYESVVAFNTYYVGSFGWGLENIMYRMSVFASRWTILFPLIGWGIISSIRRSLPYALMVLACVPALIQTPIGHYYLMIMPMCAILAGVGVASIATIIERRSQVVISVVLTAVMVVYMIANVWEQFGKSPEEMGVWIYGTGNPFAESQIVARKVQSLTDPNDRIFVAGSEPQILTYAKRLSVTRFVITYPFVINSPLAAAYQREAMQDIRDGKPKVIVLSQRPESGLFDEDSPPDLRIFLTQYLRDHYRLVGAAGYGSDTIVWRDHPSSAEAVGASLLVFTRMK